MCDDEQDMGLILNNYFREIFTSRQQTLEEIEDVVSTMVVRVDQRINQELAQVFTLAEVKRALFDMYPLKSPGPDGMSTLFYQRFWDTVGPNVIACALEFLNNKNLDPKIKLYSYYFDSKMPSTG